MLIRSSKAPHAIVQYPDSGKVGIWSRAEGYQSILRGAPTLDYWEGEVPLGVRLALERLH